MRASSTPGVAAILFGAIIAPVILAGPALANSSAAKTAEVAKTTDAASSPPCYSYEQTPDGSWKQITCQEVGDRAEQTSAVRNASKKASR
jgi:hypothetical protein